jgi:hypothetical protein
MKDIYFDIIFWIGALVIILFGLLLMLWMLLKIINTLSLFLGSMYKVYEYLIYKREFEEWIVKEGRQRYNLIMEWIKFLRKK